MYSNTAYRSLRAFLVRQPVAAALKRGILTLHDSLWDWRLGISTHGNHPSTAVSYFRDNRGYQPTSYRILNRVFSSIQIDENDVFVDYGCGKGRVTCFAGLFPFKKVYGVEISKDWCAIAKTNAETLKMRKTDIEIVSADVLDFDCTDCTIFYLFNPFSKRTFQPMLSQIRESLVKNPRKIRIIYYAFKCNALMQKSDWLLEKETLFFTFDGRSEVLLYEGIMPILNKNAAL